MTTVTAKTKITWEKLPDDFPLPDEPVDNIDQPGLAAALSDSLEVTGRLREAMLVATNYGVCARLDGKIVVKAPDWMYIPRIQVSQEFIRRSYTPHLQGDIPGIVIEFLSETEGSEYSIKPTYPPGKWYFYEQVLRVPQYGIFEPQQGVLELYQLNDSGRYDLQQPQENRYWIDTLGLFLGVWEGTKGNRQGYWLRWWDESGQLLPWGVELVEQERQRAQQEQQRVQSLIAQLRAAGIEPEA
ncbi:MAG: Uma2 family endonuclease [Coleofasciculus sp. G3-WIS-01]|uniref:Uma2 family endonuclease n=1 Tax=Coleofasciculus sp. G3-WIS-01 TaxID=3069528 RepID=UPI0032F10AE0